MNYSKDKNGYWMQTQSCSIYFQPLEDSVKQGKEVLVKEVKSLYTSSRYWQVWQKRIN